MTSSLPPLVQACSGALASATANTVSYPLDLVATKLQTSRSPHLRGINGAYRLLNHIIRVEGFTSLYDGLPTDTASTLLSNFLYFYFYTFLHALVVRLRSRAPLRKALTASTKPVLLPLPTELAIGYLAGIASRALSTPLSVITVRLQSADNETIEPTPDDVKTDRPPKPVRPVSDVVRSIYAAYGILGFWAGFAPTLPLALTPALTLLFFQLFRRVRIRGLPVSLRAFLDGALANAAALTILYPLVLTKVRVQAWKGTTMFAAWRDAFRESGWQGLYHGLAVIILKVFVSQGVTMLIKQTIEHGVVRMYAKRT